MSDDIEAAWREQDKGVLSDLSWVWFITALQKVENSSPPDELRRLEIVRRCKAVLERLGD